MERRYPHSNPQDSEQFLGEMAAMDVPERKIPHLLRYKATQELRHDVEKAKDHLVTVFDYAKTKKNVIAGIGAGVVFGGIGASIIVRKMQNAPC